MSDATQGGDPNDVVSQPLPPGVHPMDLSATVSADFDANHPAPTTDHVAKFEKGRKPFSQENYQALPVYQRASEDASAYVVPVNANSGGTAVAAYRQPGRQRITLAVPTLLADGTTVPNGVVYGFSEDEVQVVNALSPVLNPGDSVTINTEAPVWIGLIFGKTSGFCQVTLEMNPVFGTTGI